MLRGRMKKLALLVGMIVSSVLVSGCVTSNAGNCGGLSPLRLTKREAAGLSDESLRQYATQLRVGQLNCGWKAR